ncbi:MAG: thioredoxin [Lachnospiraceae bacterium]
MAVEHLKTVDFAEKVEKAEGTVLVDFYAQWCGPCKMLAPAVEALAEANPNVKVYKVNTDEESGLAARFGIMSIPTLIVFRDGQKVKESVGLISKSELEALIQ